MHARSGSYTSIIYTFASVLSATDCVRGRLGRKQTPAQFVKRRCTVLNRLCNPYEQAARKSKVLSSFHHYESS